MEKAKERSVSPPMSAIPLSIVIPTHDSRAITLACLESLAAAHRTASGPVEVVVVDDGSSDGTAEAVRQAHPEASVVRHAVARGFSAAANRGLEEAQGDLLWLLNSDTEVAPDALVEVVRSFASHPSLGVLGAQLSYPDGRPQWSGGPAPTLLWLLALASGFPSLLAGVPGYRRIRPLAGSDPRPVDWVTGAALALRREVWESCGPLDEAYRFYAQDLDLCLTARRAGWQVAVVPGVRVVHHHGATIAQDPGSHSGRQQPALLWTDLVRWARKQRGRGWARRARRALILGGRLRLLARWLLTLWVLWFRDAEKRRAWRRDTEAFRQALRALRSEPVE